MKLSVLRLVSAVCVLSALASPAFATSAPASSQPPLPTPLKNMSDEGAQIRYLGRDSGLDGWVAIKGGEQQYFYVTPDQQGIVMGVMFNNKGDVVTLRQVNELRQKEGPAIDKLAGFPDPATDAAKAPATAPAASAAPDFNNPQALIDSAKRSKSDQLYEAVAAANWITIGQKDAPVIYSFIDPECPHCHELIQDVRKSGFLEKGLVQLRLIPVGVMSEESLIEASYLLAAPNAQDLLFKHLDGTANVLMVDPNVNTQGVQRNMALMQDWKFDVTPFSIYKDAGGKVKILRGRPSDLKKVVAELR